MIKSSRHCENSESLASDFFYIGLIMCKRNNLKSVQFRQIKVVQVKMGYVLNLCSACNALQLEFS